MAYVRWSCDGHRSDVYAYEDCYGGFVLHVASRRRVGVDSIPEDLPLDGSVDPAIWLERHQRRSDAYAALPWEPVPHDDAGQSFDFATLRELRDQLAEYAADGLIRVPEWVVPMLDEEIEGKERDG